MTVHSSVFHAILVKELKPVILLAFLLILSSTLTSCGQSGPVNLRNYTVDKAVKGEAENMIRRYKGESNCTFQISLFDSASTDSVLSAEIMPGLSFSSHIDGAVSVNSMNGIDDGIGYALMFDKDSCMCKVELFSSSDTLLFGVNEGDIPSPQVFVPCRQFKVTTDKGPDFKAGDIIAGKVTLLSERFYEYRHGKKKKWTVRLSSYFKAEPLPVMNKQYKVLKRKLR